MVRNFKQLSSVSQTSFSELPHNSKANLNAAPSTTDARFNFVSDGVDRIPSQGPVRRLGQPGTAREVSRATALPPATALRGRV